MSRSLVELPSWHVEVDGCHNFRDAGGWPTVDGRRMRTGRFYRSDDALRITSTGRAAVDALGLTLVVDLRQHDQYLRRPGFLGEERTAHIPLVDQVIDRARPPRIDDEADLVLLYEDMLERGHARIASALDALAVGLDDGPVMVHCAYGKDRAGLVTALVQAAVGVTPEAIIDDFGRSHEPAMRRRAESVAAPLPDDPDTSNVPVFLFSAHRGTMRLLLERRVAEHGSLDAWVATFPTRPDTIGRLRDALVE